LPSAGKVSIEGKQIDIVLVKDEILSLLRTPGLIRLAENVLNQWGPFYLLALFLQ